MIEVILDKTAAPAEVQTVKQTFEGAGLLAEVSADLEHASATLPPWVIYVTVATASLFFSGFVPAAGADAWNGLRDLVGKLYRARDRARPPKGAVVIRVTDVRERVVFGDGLPDVAYREIVAIEIVETKSGQLRWDPKTETWRDAFDIDT